MEMGSVLEFLDHSVILVTGGAGFLAKVFVEKVLRVQPNIKKLYLLIRASDTDSAMLRFQNEVLANRLFRILKEKNGANFDSLISEKITVVAGDISLDNFGIKDFSVLQEMLEQVEVVVNLAANTNFDERYDVSIGVNTLGAKHVLNFSKACPKLKVLVHVSTAYVCGEKCGLILETPFKMGETLNGTSGFDIDLEKKLADETLAQLKADNCSDELLKSYMKDLGIQRARKYGWPNTYVFTKAMGEMLIGELKGNLPTIIIRPSIITSTYIEPVPGWTEGFRTLECLAIGYGTGKLKCLLADPKTILDLIPVDMVVNAMIVAMMAGANRADETIYQIGSSVANPIKLAEVQHYGQAYFMRNPWVDKNGHKIIVTPLKIFSCMKSFDMHLSLRYMLPIKVFEVFNNICFGHFSETYRHMRRKIDFLVKLMHLYNPYLFFKGRLDDTNTVKLRSIAVEKDLFYFDPKMFNWEEYLKEVYFPGLEKYVVN